MREGAGQVWALCTQGEGYPPGQGWGLRPAAVSSGTHSPNMALMRKHKLACRGQRGHGVNPRRAQGQRRRALCGERRTRGSGGTHQLAPDGAGGEQSDHGGGGARGRGLSRRWGVWSAAGSASTECLQAAAGASRGYGMALHVKGRRFKAAGGLHQLCGSPAPPVPAGSWGRLPYLISDPRAQAPNFHAHTAHSPHIYLPNPPRKAPTMPLTDDQHKAFMRRAIELSKQAGVVHKTGEPAARSADSGVAPAVAPPLPPPRHRGHTLDGPASLADPACPGPRCRAPSPAASRCVPCRRAAPVPPLARRPPFGMKRHPAIP